MTDLRQSEKYGRFMEKIGWKVAEYKVLSIKYKAYVKKLPFLPFSIIKIQRPDFIPFNQLDQIAKKYHALFIKIEPCNTESTEDLRKHGFRPDKSPLLPTKTLLIDLTQSEDEIFNQFKKDCRSEIRKAEKSNLNILISQYPNILISSFISLWHQNAWHRGFWIPIKKQILSLWEAFDKDSFLVATNSQFPIPNSQLLAGALIVFYNKTAYYSYAASSAKGRELAAPYLVVWKAIKLAKSKGCRIFDFEGIYDERFPIKSWLGFSHFKKSFCGKEVEYPGCFTKIYHPALRFIPLCFDFATFGIYLPKLSN